MNIQPLVSICIPTYNSEKFLKEMLDSIVAQTYKNIEVIVSDNASVDGTSQIAREYCNKYQWNFFQNKINIGAGANFNKLIELANGEYIAIYHADDVYMPTIVEDSIKAFKQNGEIGIVGTMGVEIDSSGIEYKSISLPKSLTSKNEYSFDDIFTSILNQEGLFLVTPSIMVRASIYQELGSFRLNERYKSAADYEMWFRIMQKNKIALIDKQLIRYRRHENQGSQHEIYDNVKKPDSLNVYLDYAKNNYSKYGDLYEYSFYRLMRVLAVKLNNSKEFSKSNQVICEIIELNQNFNRKLLWLLLMNKFRLRVKLNSFIVIKKILKKIGIVK
ncbi:MAG: hypothetical protein KU28_00465 [Sulfurovum sp. PC08-66]|nr:MAG: hypothetical protein KU28_00465 [Sulfurovum sp. PC08-66]KIM12442.1 MAG: hypothetical protein KU37_00585 [Sulfuricurvum sp. PC08-66]